MVILTSTKNRREEAPVLELPVDEAKVENVSPRTVRQSRAISKSCQLIGAFAGFLPTVGRPSAVALTSYFVDRSDHLVY
jgi:hypothetical protein